MPIYDYRCTSCGHRFEARQGFNDDPVAQCPTCGDNSERLITAVAVHFKGSGFYKTDYKSGNGRTSANSNGANSNGDAKTADSKSEKSKTETSAASGTSKDSARASSKDSGNKTKTKETVAKSDG